MRLHQRGVDLLVNIQDALSHVDRLPTNDMQDLLKEMEAVLHDLLARDVPVEPTASEGEAD